MFSSVLVQAEDICHQPPDTGPCKAEVIQYYFDPRRLGSTKCSLMEGAKEMKKTSLLKSIERIRAPEKAKRTGTEHKFR